MEQILHDALLELAEADQDVLDHFKRYPRMPISDDNPQSKDPYMGRKDVEIDWCRCLHRKDAAISKLISIAQNLLPKQVNPVDAGTSSHELITVKMKKI